MTDDSDSVVAREQSLRGFETVFPIEVISEIAPLCVGGWYRMLRRQFTLEPLCPRSKMYRIVLACEGVPADPGAIAAWAVYVIFRRQGSGDHWDALPPWHAG